MNNKIKIKVIKKDAPKIEKALEIAEEVPEKDITPELTSTVSGWINEFQQRRREETASAIKQFHS